MPAKNISAVQRLAQSLRMSQRQYSRTLLPSKDPFDMAKSVNGQREWPQREESFAAAQLSKQSRNWRTVRKYGKINMISNNVDQTRRGFLPRRNNIIAAKNAKRNVLKEEILSKLMDRDTDPEQNETKKWNMDIANNQAYRKQRQRAFRQISNDSQQNHRQYEEEHYPEQSQKRQHQREKAALDEDYQPRDVRDVVFGVQDNNEEDLKIQREADNDLLNRVFKTRPKTNDAPISKRVIAPYLTYKSHRNSWAEFRHRMIYGGTPF